VIAPEPMADWKNTMIVVLGSGGILGRAWTDLLERSGARYRAFDVDRVDLTRPETLEILHEISPAWVVNCAAYTDVDAAESNAAVAQGVNGEGVGNLVQACRRLNAFLTHYSTDYVFSGEGTSPYAVDSAPDPLSVYGRTKLAGEVIVRESGRPHLLIRTSWLYAAWGSNFVRTIVRRAAEAGQLCVVDDQHGRPTSARHLAATSLKLLQRGASGTWHVTDGGECTWYELACEIVRLLNAPCRVEPCASDAYPRPAKRPGYSVLDISATEKELGPMPHWKQNVAAVVAELAKPRQAGRGVAGRDR